MNDGDFEVDILDDQAQINGKKLRKDIVKGVDVYHAVYGVVVTPEGQLVISLIGNPEGMPNLHAGKLGCTCATIRRIDESGDEAMKRAIKKELNISSSPQILFEEFVDIDNTKRLISFYVIVSEMPENYNKEDITELKKCTKTEFEELLTSQPQNITPPLKLFYTKYKF